MAASLGLVAALACTTLGASSAASASTGEIEVDYEGLTPSAELSTPVVASGQLEGYESGDGGAVVLYAWPSNEVLASLAEGESVETVPLGYAIPDASGRFELRVSDYAAADRYRHEDGIVNAQLIAGDGDAFYSYSFASSLPESDVASRTTAGEASEAGEDVALVSDSFDISLKPLDASEEDGQFQVRAETTSLDVDTETASTTCTTLRQSTLGNVWANVGYGYSTRGGAKMDFNYHSGAQSILGIGLSSSGAAGSFNANGTASIYSNESVTDFPTAHGENYIRWQTKFQYAKFKTTCVSIPGGVTFQAYEARPVAFVGGTQSFQSSGAPTANYCTSFAGGSHFTKNNTAAYEASTAVSSAGILGVNLSAKTGYSTKAGIKFTFTKDMQLCGTNGYPGGTPSRLVAK